MKNWFRKTGIVCAWFACFHSLQAQQTPLPDEIQNFKRQDSINPPPQRAILFVGSSAFHSWTNVQAAFPGYTIINRGVENASIPDITRYVNDIIFPYNPKEVVIDAGDDDITSGEDSRVVADNFKELFLLIRKNLPNDLIVYVSMKPSLGRIKYMKLIKQANQIIKNFLWQQQNVGYADVFNAMLDENGQPRSELFKEDSLHVNDKGYATWQKTIQPYLLKP